MQQIHLARIEQESEARRQESEARRQESEARRDAEEQLSVLIESSPAAVLTTDAGGRILLANEAAHRLFAVPSPQLAGLLIRDFLPSLANVRAPDEKHSAFRTAMQCRGCRQNGEVFLADIWFSTYRTSAGPRLAAMVVDTSEDLRTREESSLHHLLAGSRILVGAVSHEIRNVCGAIAMAHANLARGNALAGNKDFEALGSLIAALERIAAMDLRQTTDARPAADQAGKIDLTALLDEFRIIVEPSLSEEGITLAFAMERPLPQVWADRQSLLQVFLNLTKNSQRAMAREATRRLAISARYEKQRVTVRFRDTGCGVSHPDRLFRPFQQQAEATGLGLYLSRAFARSFRGDLRYEPEPDGSSFIVELAPVPAGGAGDRAEAAKIYEEPGKDYGPATDPDTAPRRSQPLPRESTPASRS